MLGNCGRPPLKSGAKVVVVSTTSEECRGETDVLGRRATAFDRSDIALSPLNDLILGTLTSFDYLAEGFTSILLRLVSRVLRVPTVEHFVDVNLAWTRYLGRDRTPE